MMAIEERVRELEHRIEAAHSNARDCVRELLVDDDARYLIAERLPALGSAIVPAVRELIDDPKTDPEVRRLAALAGLAVGDSEQSALVLLDEIEARGEFAPIAARRLADARVAGAGLAIERALRATPLDHVDVIVAYLEALKECGIAVPEDERRRLSAGPWQVTSALAEWHPPSKND